ncbi:S41 family peptidase [Lacimicrobium sp. SS2-24]|uniref:S41 family peptidase n=1 Tax=Lacimicrobium sp. SS2-24 TaxID=2005569 RepID=UPI000B4C17AA|nr:S41 family peptidase [Lacimicrobium sp. SS2-24]
MLNNIKFTGLILLTAVGLSACGGGGQSNFNPPTSGSSGGTGPQWQAGVYAPESELKDFCAAPRSGIDPYSGRAYPDKAGSATYEKLWLRSWSNNTYLWYDELDDINPAGYGVQEYFDLLKTDARTPSGAFKDNFHFYQDTAEYKQRTQSGVESGYGIEWKFSALSPPRKLEIAFIEPGSPADLAGLVRGDEVVEVDGVDFINGGTQNDVNTINNGLFPSIAGESHDFVFETVAGERIDVTMASADVQITPVQNASVIETDLGRVGYVQFNSHIALAQDQLIDAFELFVNENATELVVDLRYNGGGLLVLASQLGYMVAGDANTAGRTFEQMQFNDKHPSRDPVTGDPLVPLEFVDKRIDYDRFVETSESLPTLALNRVFVLATDGTCSASEAFINGLRGIDVEVILIGDQTCGKPYGFYPTDNCGTTYFTIQFTGVNDKGFGEYSDGFLPTPSPQFPAEVLGCMVEDDLSLPLGNPQEGQLRAALDYMSSGSCPQSSGIERFSQKTAPEGKGLQIKRPDPRYRATILENKLYQQFGRNPESQP